MHTDNPALTQERLRTLFDYNPETGIFTRIGIVNGRQQKGVAGGIDHGYVCIGVVGKRHYAHRLAWLYVYGRWPEIVDHINGDGADNRIANLREITISGNLENQRSGHRNSSTGLLGVSPHGSRWRAAIRANKETTRLGVFDTPELAHQAYVAAKRKLHAAGML
jgi:hypothetical protein